MGKRLILATAVGFALIVSAMSAGAVIKSFIKEYTYQASELDSKTSCRTIALEQVKRELLDELGTYVESTTVVSDYTLEKDEIRTISAGVVQTRLVDEKWDGKEYWLKAEVSADPDEVAASIARVRNDTKLAEELAEAEAEKEEALDEVERLKAELADAQADKKHYEEKLDQYNSAVNQLQASDSFEQGTAMAVAGDYEGASKAYDRAIELRPDNAKAFFNRSMVYIYLGDYNRATSDLDRAMTIKPANTGAYFQRAAAYKEIREKKFDLSGRHASPFMRRPQLSQAPTDDPLQKYLDRKQVQHNISRINPFQPKARLNKTDRPLRPAIRRPALERNRMPSVTDPSHMDNTQTIHQPARPAPARRSLAPDRPRIRETKRPAIRRPAPIAPGQREDHQPVSKPRIEPLKRKDAKEGQEDKHRKRDREDQDREKPLHR